METLECDLHVIAMPCAIAFCSSLVWSVKWLRIAWQAKHEQMQPCLKYWWLTAEAIQSVFVHMFNISRIHKDTKN